MGVKALIELAAAIQAVSFLPWILLALAVSMGIFAGVDLWVDLSEDRNKTNK